MLEFSQLITTPKDTLGKLLCILNCFAFIDKDNQTAKISRAKLTTAG